MSFFDALGSIFSAVAPIASVAAPIIGGLAAGKKASQTTPAATQSGQMSADAVAAIKASMDPNDPMYRNLVRLEEESARYDIAQAINEQMRQRAKYARKYGDRRYGAVFNPEREDEAMGMAVARGATDIGRAARGTARDILSRGATQLQGGVPGVNALVGPQTQQNAIQGNTYANIGTAIGDAAKGFSTFAAPQTDFTNNLANQMALGNIYGYNYYGGPR